MGQFNLVGSDKQAGGGMKLSLVCSVILVAVCCLVDNASCVISSWSLNGYKAPHPVCLADEKCKKNQELTRFISGHYQAAKLANYHMDINCYTGWGALEGVFIGDKDCLEAIALAEKLLKAKTADEYDKLEKLVIEARQSWQPKLEEYIPPKMKLVK